MFRTYTCIGGYISNSIRRSYKQIHRAAQIMQTMQTDFSGQGMYTNRYPSSPASMTQNAPPPRPIDKGQNKVSSAISSTMDKLASFVPNRFGPNKRMIVGIVIVAIIIAIGLFIYSKSDSDDTENNDTSDQKNGILNKIMKSKKKQGKQVSFGPNIQASKEKTQKINQLIDTINNGSGKR